MIVETQEKKRSTKFQGENLDNFFKMTMITRLCLQLFKYSKTNQFLQSWGIRKDKNYFAKQTNWNKWHWNPRFLQKYTRWQKFEFEGQNNGIWPKSNVVSFDPLLISYWSNFNDTYLPYSDSGYLQYQQRAVQFSGQCVFYFLFFKIHRYSDCFLLL